MSASRTVVAARVFVALTAIVVAFQLALAAGAPWGSLTMGGAFPGALPPRMRVVAVGSAILAALFAAIVASRAGLGLAALRRHARWSIWLVVAYTFVGVLLNAITRSAGERALWLPVTVVLAVCVVIVARSD